MLKPDVRHTLLEALRPPDGYRVSDVVACTYSLDLLALLAPPLSFSMQEHRALASEDRKPTTENAYLLLKSLRECAGSMTIFHQAGKVRPLVEATKLLAYLEGSVVAVNAPESQASFHPKIWVTRFELRDDDQDVRYRVLITSRNITFDASWDLVVSLDGNFRGHRQNAFRSSAPLATFIEALPGLAVTPMDKQRVRRLAEVADEIRRVEFDPPEHCDELEFFAHGLGKPSPILSEPVDRMLVVSPFVNAVGLDLLFGGESAEMTLLTREVTLRQLGSKPLQRSNIAALIMKEQATPDAFETDQDSQQEESLQDLHAKAYVFDKGRKAKVWLGSANATSAGLERNVEFMVGLSSTRSKLGVDAWLEGLKDITQPATTARDLDEATLERMALERNMEYALAALASLGWSGKVRPDDARELVGETHEIQVVGKARNKAIAGDAAQLLRKLPQPALRVRPVTVGEAWWRKCQLGTLPLTITTPAITAAALTSFLVLELQVELPDGGHLARATVVNCTLLDVPEGRQAAILEGLLSEPGALLRFLRLLLCLDNDESEDILDLWGLGSLTGSRGYSDNESPLLEATLKALQKEPERCRALVDIVRELATTATGVNIVGPDLLKLCTSVEEALGNLSSRKGASQ